MPKIYDQDLRDKVIAYLEVGHTANAASKIFNLAANTIRNWHKRYKEEGHCKARNGWGRKERVSCQEFSAYVKAHPDLFLKQIGNHFNMTAVGALYHMRKNGFRYKKKSLDIKKPVQKKGRHI